MTIHHELGFSMSARLKVLHNPQRELSFGRLRFWFSLEVMTRDDALKADEAHWT
jgi:hypothetical protein